MDHNIHNLHHHLHQNLPHHPLLGGITTMNVVDVSGVATAATGATVDSRLPQWSVQETKEFLAIRAELDQNFMETKRNRQLWQLISNTMADKGYFRSPEQCKCKWKNLVTRYKGCETAEPESVRQQFPFYKELEAIFTGRMQRMVWAEAEGGGGAKNKAAVAATGNASSEEDDDNNEEISADNNEGGERIISSKKKKKLIKRSSKSKNKKLKEILEEFMRQQIEIERKWMEAFRERERERRMREREWREAMEAVENERKMMEQRWRERDEERRIREEARAETRDALITALLNKLISRPHI